MTRIVLLEKIHASAVAHLNAEGFSRIVPIPTALKTDALQALPRLKAIGCFCIGTNQVDLNAAAVQAACCMCTVTSLA